MLDKLLRARLPEQIVALLEKLEQDPDASHLEKVERLLDYHASNFTRYEEWVIKRQMRKIRNVIRREETLNRVMQVVINDKSEEEKREAERAAVYNSYTQNLAKSMNSAKNAIGGTLLQHAQMHQDQVQLIKAHQAQQQARYSQGWTDSRVRGYL